VAKTIIEKEFLEQIFKAIPSILSFPYKKMWIDYYESDDKNKSLAFGESCRKGL